MDGMTHGQRAKQLQDGHQRDPWKGEELKTTLVTDGQGTYIMRPR